MLTQPFCYIASFANIKPISRLTEKNVNEMWHINLVLDF